MRASGSVFYSPRRGSVAFAESLPCGRSIGSIMLEGREQRLGMEHNRSPHRWWLRENSTDRRFGDDRRGRARARAEDAARVVGALALTAILGPQSMLSRCACRCCACARVEFDGWMVLVGRKTSPTGLLLCSPWRVTLTLFDR